jgi:biopolymer transport protein ExbD
VQYGRISEVLNAVIQAGYKKFTFVSGPEEIEKAASKARR